MEDAEFKVADALIDAQSKRIDELEAALEWGERLYSGYSLQAMPQAGVGLEDGPGAWIGRVRELLHSKAT